MVWNNRSLQSPFNYFPLFTSNASYDRLNKEQSSRRFFHKGYLYIRTKDFWEEGRMEKEQLTWFKQVICDHSNQRQYTQRQFDILKGFELIATRCINCHKILTLKIIKFDKCVSLQETWVLSCLSKYINRITKQIEAHKT